MPLVLGIDPGTHCGWALLDGERRLGSGTWDLSARRHEGGGMRYLRLRAYLLQILEAHPVEAIAYEEVRRHMGVDAAHVYGGIVAVIASLCEERAPKLPYKAVPVGTVKKLATGKGNADKVAMVEAANARWGLALPVYVDSKGRPATDHDDEADALWVGLTFQVELGWVVMAEAPIPRPARPAKNPTRARTTS